LAQKRSCLGKESNDDSTTLASEPKTKDDYILSQNKIKSLELAHSLNLLIGDIMKLPIS
jgi:hypothetical protein